ncbi:hypothetical protein ES332_A08G009300v1 [Gossypium tomentosum]|uniref:Tubulin/FtsZ GTPase domain-containing protein n=1 Tax=Gossypium tomentosum TaxID=34277 RepID=A0A5D2PA45_GOSTO|nr:hypothetical protein ES332_A08G009300v1 [Gossypium tomentosum]
MATCVITFGSQSSIGLLSFWRDYSLNERLINKASSLRYFNGVAYKKQTNLLSLLDFKCCVNFHNKLKLSGEENDAMFYSTTINESLRETCDPSYNYGEAKIKVVGVGGGGSNAVNRMVEHSLKGVEFLIVNTDAQALKMSPMLPNKCLQIGQELTRGLGAGGKPEIGMNAANESREAIEEAVHGADMVFVMVKEQTGHSVKNSIHFYGRNGRRNRHRWGSVIAGIAKSKGILTVGIVTTPFSFEGRKRAVQAQEGIAALRENLLAAVSQATLMTEAFNLADDILRQGVRGISDIITIPGLVNVDFADVHAIMKDAYGDRYCNCRARDAALNAIQSPLLDIGIERATGIVWNITSGTDLTLFEVNAAAEVIYDLVDPKANLIFGAVIDPSLCGQVSITLIATGFKRQEDRKGKASLFSLYLFPTFWSHFGSNLSMILILYTLIKENEGDVSNNFNKHFPFTNDGSLEIPKFLKKKSR